jgi:DNA-directed RNA polymerase specialized sigma24 family protein
MLLNPRQRALICLKRCGGFASQKDLGAALGLSQGNVSRLISETREVIAKLSGEVTTQEMREELAALLN